MQDKAAIAATAPVYITPTCHRTPRPRWTLRILYAAWVFVLGVLVGACTHLLH